MYKPVSQTLRISGAWEYMRPDGAAPEKKVLEALAKAYQHLQYDIAFAAEEEADEFDRSGLALDRPRSTASEARFSKVRSAEGDWIGVVLFPALPQGQAMPKDKQIDRITRLIEQHRDEVKLLIGLSPWGWTAEREYLAVNPSHVPDILLGSGRGSGVDGRIEAEGRCLWVRPYDKGRTMNEIQVKTWPERSSTFRWTDPEGITTISISLGDQYQDNDQVGAILDQ